MIMLLLGIGLGCLTLGTLMVVIADADAGFILSLIGSFVLLGTFVFIVGHFIEKVW